MPLIETESLVLKSYNLAEADRIVVFFTREHGLVRGVAKGAKRLKSKFGSSLELFSTVQLTYFQKEERELVSIQNVEMTRSRFAQAADPAFLETFSYFSDLLSAFAPPHDADEKLYRMTQACLAAATENPHSLSAIRLYFELWLLRLGGYLPDWKLCTDCKREISANQPANLQSSFHLLCSNCQRTAGTVVSPLHREVFYNVQKLSPVEFIEFSSANTEAVNEVSSVMQRIISQIVGREVSLVRQTSV